MELKKEAHRPKKVLSLKGLPKPINGKFYEVNELAELLGVHKHTIQARIRCGDINARKYGGTWRILPEE